VVLREFCANSNPEACSRCSQTDARHYGQVSRAELHTITKMAFQECCSWMWWGFELETEPPVHMFIGLGQMSKTKHFSHQKCSKAQSHISPQKFVKNFGREHANARSRWEIAVEFRMDFNRSELSSLNFNSSVRAEQSIAIRYPNVVIKSLCGNLDIYLNYYAYSYFRSRNYVRVLLVADRDWKWKMLFKSCFSVALLNSFLDFCRKKLSTQMQLLNFS